MVEKTLVKILKKASNKNSLEEVVKSHVVEKVMVILDLMVKRTISKKALKIAVKKAFNRAWEKRREDLIERLSHLILRDMRK